MKFGCFGCLSLLVLGFILCVLVGAGIIGWNILYYPQNPEQVRPTYSSEEALRGQQKLAEILLRDAGLSFRRDPVVISQRELNGFLARHLQESRGMPFSPLILRFRRGEVAVEGGVTVGSLLQGFPWHYLVGLLPRGFLGKKVWISLEGTVRVTAGRLDIDVTDFVVGKQTLPPRLLRWAIGPQGNDLLSFRLPRTVDRVEVEEGRAIVISRSR